MDECPIVDFETFQRDIVPANRPVVIRGLVEQWPVVTFAQQSDDELCKYLKSIESGEAVYTIAASPQANGRFFYNKDLTQLNFKRGQIPLAQVLDQLLSSASEINPHSIAVQSLSVRDVLPAFERNNKIIVLEAEVAPTMWIGNRGQVAAHYDVHRNLACVVAGKRQFRLFPPQQIENLYLGPMMNAPGGVPISLVDIWQPDLDKFPRYAEAQQQMLEATLEPGDAIYIPSLWWHAVASLAPFNVLVNYWWGGVEKTGISANDSLLHGMLTIANLDQDQRAAWREYFDYFVFKTKGDPSAHLPAHIEDIVKNPNDEQLKSIAEFLASRLR